MRLHEKRISSLNGVLCVVRLVERVALVSLLLIMVLLFATNVAVRQIGGPLAADLAWVDETVRLMNIYLVFLAAGLALERGKQVAVDSWRETIIARTGLPLKRIIDLTGLVFSLYLAFLSIRMARFVWSMGQRSATLDIPIAWIYIAPAIGFALLALRYCASLFGGIDRYTAAEKGHGE
ncbi:TRAP transporter small permease [Rhodobacterales bacterium]|nr:TRAP transporter small permease [Rhodobacterales bacterium]